MPTSYGALCTDFYVNMKLGVKMDLPSERDTVLNLFDRIRKERPTLTRFRRYEGELALESRDKDEPRQQWVALRRTSVRGGSVNPDSLADSYALHTLILTLAPFYLGVSPLDIDLLELTFGFDLEAPGNHNAIVRDTLLAGSPLASLLDADRMTPIDVQPLLGVTLNRSGSVQAFVDVKTRTTVREVRTGQFREEPISVFLTIRRLGAIDDVRELPKRFETLAREAERLAESRLVPQVITPLREKIASEQF